MYVTKFVDNTQYGQSSVVQYASYLEKESLAQGGNTRQFSAYLDKQNDVVRVEGREYFFNGESEHFSTEDLVKRIGRPDIIRSRSRPRPRNSPICAGRSPIRGRPSSMQARMFPIPLRTT